LADPAVGKLRAAAAGLTFVSESDAPFEAFEWASDGDLTPAAVRQLGGHAKSAAVAEVAFDSFFAALVTEQDWYGDEEKEQVRNYRGLLAVLQAELTEPKIFRVGKGTVTYYVVGRSKKGRWVGVKTQATQT
jgi:hypothetical protein